MCPSVPQPPSTSCEYLPQLEKALGGVANSDESGTPPGHLGLHQCCPAERSVLMGVLIMVATVTCYWDDR